MGNKKRSSIEVITIDADIVRSLNDLIKLMRSRPPLSTKEKGQLRHEYFARLKKQLFENNMTFGEATGSPGTEIHTTDETEFRQHLRSIDNNLKEQVRIVTEGIYNYFANGVEAAPYYAWRIAIILRKAKLVTLEADFLEAFSKLFQDCVGGRYKDIRERVPKARQLAMKSS